MTLSKIKHYVVVCNNLREWELFVELSMFNLSKQNHPYKLSLQNKRLIDLHKNICYIYVQNNLARYNLYGTELDNIIAMCNVIDTDLLARLHSQMRREYE